MIGQEPGFAGLRPAPDVGNGPTHIGATIVVILANLVADLLLARLDPRIGTADA